MLTPEQRDQYRRDGFLVIPGFKNNTVHCFFEEEAFGPDGHRPDK